MTTRTALAAAAVFGLLSLAACSAPPSNTAESPRSPTQASPSSASPPSLSPYEKGYAHGQERRNDTQFAEKPIAKTGDWKADLHATSNEDMRRATAIATHCSEWSKSASTGYDNQSTYSKGCSDAIYGKPPAPLG
ncbi:hypothetical protein ABZ891_34575 [Streptomyces sp. NPDC047023]|uniref:hypothetical protein n=1 Tax=Streptomyces sp. NPDC047023 TaxID=3155139 RepID=UPI0033C20D76